MKDWRSRIRQAAEGGFTSPDLANKDGTARSHISVVTNASLPAWMQSHPKESEPSVFGAGASRFDDVDEEVRVVRHKLLKFQDGNEYEKVTALQQAKRMELHETHDQYLLEKYYKTGTSPYTKKDRLKYKLQDLIDRYPVMKLLVLTAVLGFGNIIGGFTFYMATSDEYEERPRYSDIVWLSWTYMADPGTHADVNSGTKARTIAFLIAVFGILYFAVVIGFVVDVIHARMDAIKHGSTPVVEKGHFVIVGWTDRTVPLIKELILAAESEGGISVVIMADMPKPTMEQELRFLLPIHERKNSTVICRKGSPGLARDLIRISAFDARVTIVLAPPGDPDQADALVLRTLLALRSLGEPLRGYIVAELRDVDNSSLLEMVDRSIVETIISHDLIGRLLLQSSREPGLAGVYCDLFGFEGAEFYFSQWDELNGRTFEEAIYMFPDAIPIGVKHPGKTLMLNPPSTHIIKPDTTVVFLAHDDDTYFPLSEPILVESSLVHRPEPPEPEPEFVLICGWRRDVDDMLVMLDSVLPKGSLVHMLATVPIADRDQVLFDGGLDASSLVNITVKHLEGNSSKRYRLEQLPIERYTSITILADETLEEDIVQCDSHTVTTLLLLRDICIQRRRFKRKAMGEGHVRRTAVWKNLSNMDVLRDAVHLEDTDVMIVCEILDARTRSLIQSNQSLAGVADFIMTNDIVSRVLAMVAYNRNVKEVIDQLTSVGFCSINVHEVVRYCEPGEVTSFWTLQQRCREKGFICLGYKLDAEPSCAINPISKERSICWGVLDVAIVLTERQDVAIQETTINLKDLAK
eukprot:Rmarinus@m.15581